MTQLLGSAEALHGGLVRGAQVVDPDEQLRVATINTVGYYLGALTARTVESSINNQDARTVVGDMHLWATTEWGQWEELIGRETSWRSALMHAAEYRAMNDIQKGALAEVELVAEKVLGNPLQWTRPRPFPDDSGFRRRLLPNGIHSHHKARSLDNLNRALDAL